MLNKPTREEWIGLRIEAGIIRLGTLLECPECHHKKMEDSLISRVNRDYMEVQNVYCNHPWHLVRLCEGDPWLMAIGLPNMPSYDKNGIKDMQERVLRYAIREKLEVKP